MDSRHKGGHWSSVCDGTDNKESTGQGLALPWHGIGTNLCDRIHTKSHQTHFIS